MDIFLFLSRFGSKTDERNGVDRNEKKHNGALWEMTVKLTKMNRILVRQMMKKSMFFQLTPHPEARR